VILETYFAQANSPINPNSITEKYSSFVIPSLHIILVFLLNFVTV